MNRWFIWLFHSIVWFLYTQISRNIVKSSYIYIDRPISRLFWVISQHIDVAFYQNRKITFNIDVVKFEFAFKNIVSCRYEWLNTPNAGPWPSSAPACFVFVFFVLIAWVNCFNSGKVKEILILSYSNASGFVGITIINTNLL